jgi:hypothetical protein
MKSRLNIEVAVQVVIIVLAFAIGSAGDAAKAPKTRLLKIAYNSQTVKGII